MLIASAAQAQLPEPPVAQRIPYTVKSPQGDRVDEYYWLRDDDTKAKRPEIMSYLRAEKAYADAYMAPLQPLKTKLVAEMRARIKEDDSSVPFYDNGYWYWRHFNTGAEYPVYFRHAGTAAAMNPGTADEIILDVPKLAEGKSYYRIGGTGVSPDNRWLAYTEDTLGRRMFTLRVRDLSTGAVLPEAIPGVLPSLVWAADNRTLFYIKQDPVTLQSGPVFRHVAGTEPREDTMVYDEADKTLFTDIHRSASRDFVVIAIEGFDTTETLVVPSKEPATAPRVVIPRRAGIRSYADHLHGRWVIRTNDAALNFRLVEAADPANRAAWKDMVPHRKDAALDDFALFNDAIAIQERVAANMRVRVLRSGTSVTAPADEAAYVMALSDNPDPAAAQVRYSYSSLVSPTKTYQLDLSNGERKLMKVQPVPTYDSSKYRSERLWAPSRDGKRIPISIVYRPELFKKNGTAPMLLIGYGSYGLSYDPSFDLRIVSLVDRGFVVGIAHVRGGAELGQQWYEDGRLLHKKNTFNDFVDATDYLVKNQYAARDRMFAEGGSAGGLLMGAIANQAGNRYRAIALRVPFVDAVTTMLDETIPLTANEWTQWGDPRTKGAYQYMLSYSPYDNIAHKPYPALFVSTGLWDSQVQYYEPAKYVARLRATKTDKNPLVFHINMEAGHSGRSGRFEVLEERGLEYAFFLSLLGIKE
ncbi:MAG: S9 family peptidase [Betaproteobacteria bacterium]|nr:S9 family peptidase [Betaproteobacteria bacterium]